MRLRFGRVAATAIIMATCSIFMFVPAGATLQGLQAGMEAPDFSLTALSGKTGKFADLKGNRLTAVVFWSTWSKKSEILLARMQKLYDKYRDNGFAVIAINADDQRLSLSAAAEIRKMAERLKLSYPILLDNGLGTFHEYGVIALPSTLLLDRDRVIKYELSGYPLEGAEEMADYITATLEGKKPASAAKSGHQPNKNAIRLFNMAKNAQQSKRTPDMSEMWFRKAIEADPDFMLPYLGLAATYSKRGDTELAQGMYDQVLAKDPANVIALCETGMLLVNKGQAKKGQDLLEKALKSGNTYTPCYYYAGYIYGKTGNREKALQMFDEASKMSPADYAIQAYKARMFEEAGKLPEAAAAYRGALKIILGLD